MFINQYKSVKTNITCIFINFPGKMSMNIASRVKNQMCKQKAAACCEM